MANLRESRLVPRNPNVKFGYIDMYMSYTSGIKMRLKRQTFRQDLKCNVLREKENLKYD